MRVANALIATLQDAMIEQGLEPVDALKACLLAGGLVASGCRPADAKEIRDVATAVSRMADEVETRSAKR